MKPNVLFLCTGNSCRSQMAEGWARHLHEKKLNAFSAGTKPQILNPFAVQVMQEVGIDISKHSAKHIETLSQVQFSLIVTVCDNAAESCPIPSLHTRVVHAPFSDPPQLAIQCASQDEVLQCYREVRDEIRDFVTRLPATLQNAS